MGAAKRMFDNSYNQRLETEALAKAYLDNPTVEHKVSKEEKEIKRIKSGRVCSVIGIASAMGYCLIIFGMLLMPLVRETKIHQMQVEIYQHNKEISRLKDEIQYMQSEIDDKMNVTGFEKIAREQLGMVDRDSSLVMPRVSDSQFMTVEEAKNAYYNPQIDYTSQE